MTSLKISKFNFSFTISNINALFAPVNKGLNFASKRLQQLFSRYFRYAQMTSFKFSKYNFTAAVDNLYAQFAPVNRRLNSSFFTLQQLFGKYFRYARMMSLKIKIIISPLLLAIFMRTLRQWIEWAYFMFKPRFRKYFRYAQMTSFVFETIIEFSAAIRNVYAQLLLMNRGLTSTYIMLIWMLLWDPLTYLFHWGTRVLV